MDGIRYWIETEGTGHWFFVAFPVILLVLFIWFKERRVRFLIPSLLISIIIINPIFYKYWDKMGLYAYWRILWIVPVIPIVAVLVPSIKERIDKSWIKAVVAVAGVGLIIISGTFLYNGTGGSFVEAGNASKLPDYVVQIADRLLELDENPKVIVQTPIGVYIRQYTGKINTLFGREVLGPYIWKPSNTAYEAIAQLNNPEDGLNEVSQIMLNDEYDYFVYDGDVDDNLSLVDKVGNYGIYKAEGVPSVIKEHNQLGQVTRITYVNGTGTPINNEKGYSSIQYGYDENGLISHEYRTNVDGIGVVDINGCAGYEREYDSEYHLIRERYLDENEQFSVNNIGFAENVREYYGTDVIKDIYLNPDGSTFVFLGGYSEIVQEIDEDTITTRQYCNAEGLPMMRVDGYSKAVWTQDENGTMNVHFEDTDGNTVPIDGINLVNGFVCDRDGWSEWITPTINSENSTIYLGQANLGNKNKGDIYTCQVEVEFKGVTMTDGHQFRFCSQGTTDGTWDIDNIWNWSLANLNDAPADGIYRFIYSCEIDEEMALASIFNIGFRCDYWASGTYRVRNIKIEKGDTATQWTPGV